jgi:hypothetical protein
VALTKVTGQVINDTTGLVVGVTTVGGGISATDGFFSGIVTAVGNASFSGNVSVGGTLTYEDVTNIDAVGIITARSDVLVGSGITLSPDGDIFFTGIMTGNGSGLTGVANTDVIFTDKLSIGDGAQTSGDQINIGIGSDLRLYHNGSHNYLDSVNGNIYLRVNSTENAIKCTENGNVEIAYDGSKKIETDSSGVTVTGRVAATSYTGDGSALTGIEVGMSTASAQVSGITTVVDLSKDDIRLDCTGLVTIDTKGGSEGSSHSLRIVNVGLATVSFNSYFKFPSGGAPILPTASGAISLISFTVHTQGRVGVASVFLAGSSVNFS